MGPLQEKNSLAKVDPGFRVSSLDPRLHFAYRADREAAGALAPHSGDVPSGGRHDVLRLARRYLGRRFRGLEGPGEKFRA